MKLNSFSPRRHLLVLLPVLMVALAGCSMFSASGKKNDPMTPPDADALTGTDQIARLHVGDSVNITLGGLPTDILPMDKPIKDDGTISLPDVGRVKAAGKTPGELEDAIHDLYVPRYYTHLNVTVKTSSDRVYFVQGEVHRPDRYVYTGAITVSKAIASAGDFTDFADRTEVYLTRANGQRFELNLKRILAGEDPDPPVYPGDQIEVTRRVF